MPHTIGYLDLRTAVVLAREAEAHGAWAVSALSEAVNVLNSTPGLPASLVALREHLGEILWRRVGPTPPTTTTL